MSVCCLWFSWVLQGFDLVGLGASVVVVQYFGSVGGFWFVCVEVGCLSVDLRVWHSDVS